jgi:geranylgeranyl pyrophosphate synthase
MAEIGALEGSEEAGVEEITDVDTMLARVHRVRGGQLFELSLVAPTVLEPPERRSAIQRIARAVSRLGTAFQIVDDLTDLEFDVRHGRHNLLVAQIHHRGTPEERAALHEVRASPAPFPGIEPFAGSARAVLDRARNETRRSLEELSAVGFWWPPRLAEELVRAIVGLDGLTAMERASGSSPSSPFGMRP